MKTTLALPALTTGLLALALTGCAGATPTAPEPEPQTAVASASAPASAIEPAIGSATGPTGVHQNRVHPAGTGQAQFLIEATGGTEASPTGLDFTDLPRDTEYGLEREATEFFTPAQVEQLTQDAVGKYLDMRTDPRLYEQARTTASIQGLAQQIDRDRDPQAPVTLVVTHGAGLAVIYEQLATALAGTEHQVENSTPHSVQYSQARLSGNHDHGLDFLNLMLNEHLTLNLTDGMQLRLTSTVQLVYADANDDGDPEISALGSSSDDPRIEPAQN